MKCCDPTCFDTFYDKCIESTVIDIPELKIEQGCSLHDFNTKVVEQVLKNKKAISDCSFCNGQSSNIGSSESFTSVESKGYNSCISEIYKKVRITVDSDTTISSIYYSLSELSTSLPDNYFITNTLALIKDSKNVLLYTGSSESGGSSVNYSKYPVTISLEVRISTPCGDVVLTKQLEIPAGSSSSKLFDLNVQKSLSENIQSQGEMNTLLMRKINDIESNINGSTNFTLLDCNNTKVTGSSYSELLQKLYNKICQLENKVVELESVIESKSQENSACCSQLTEKANSLQNQININTQNILSISE